MSPPTLPTQTARWLRSPCDFLADKALLGPDSPGSRVGSSGVRSPPPATDRPASPEGSCRGSVGGGGAPGSGPHTSSQNEAAPTTASQCLLHGTAGPSLPSPTTNCPMAPLVLAEKTGFRLGKNPEFSVPGLAPVKGRPGSLIPPRPCLLHAGPDSRGQERTRSPPAIAQRGPPGQVSLLGGLSFGFRPGKGFPSMKERNGERHFPREPGPPNAKLRRKEKQAGVGGTSLAPAQGSRLRGVGAGAAAEGPLQGLEPATGTSRPRAAGHRGSSRQALTRCLFPAAAALASFTPRSPKGQSTFTALKTGKGKSEWVVFWGHQGRGRSWKNTGRGLPPKQTQVSGPLRPGCADQMARAAEEGSEEGSWRSPAKLRWGQLRAGRGAIGASANRQRGR